MTKDSVVRNDSVRVRDSVVVRWETMVRDSVVVCDSVVVTLDAEGKVVKSEHYRQREHNREQNQTAASESRHEESQQGTAAATSSDTLTHWAAKTEKQGTAVPWYVWLMGGAVATVVCGMACYCAFVRKKE